MRAFGSTVIHNETKELDREKLASMIFHNKEEKRSVCDGSWYFLKRCKSLPESWKKRLTYPSCYDFSKIFYITFSREHISLLLVSYWSISFYNTN